MNKYLYEISKKLSGVWQFAAAKVQTIKARERGDREMEKKGERNVQQDLQRECRVTIKATVIVIAIM